MSECSTFVSGSPARPAPAGTAGFVQDGRRVDILDAAGQPSDRGTLAVHRSDPGLFLGYLDQPAETAAKFAGPWFLTGDQVMRTDDGAIAVLGRNDDMMNAGGFRLSPAEVEDVLALHPAAGEVAATEIEVRPGVCVVGAFWTGPAAAADLEAWAAARLAAYKRPKLWQQVDALPRTPTGKINRRALRLAFGPATG